MTMEEVSPLECMNRFIQLKNEYVEVRNKYTRQLDVYVHIHDAILREQISYPTIKATFEQTINDLNIAVESEVAHRGGNDDEGKHRSSLEHLTRVRRRYLELSARLLSLDHPQHNSLEKRLEKCRYFIRLFQGKLDELKEKFSDLGDVIRLCDNVKVHCVKDVNTVLFCRGETDWRGKISLADELDISQKNALTRYISSTPLADALDLQIRFTSSGSQEGLKGND